MVTRMLINVIFIFSLPLLLSSNKSVKNKRVPYRMSAEHTDVEPKAVSGVDGS